MTEPPRTCAHSVDRGRQVRLVEVETARQACRADVLLLRGSGAQKGFTNVIQAAHKDLRDEIER
eukprot:3106333-Pleurochrysis_carterae.AAC.2